MLKRNSISVQSITRPQLSLQSENQLVVWVILDFFFTVSLKAHACFLNIEWVQFVFVFVRGLYDKSNASLYCFTSDVMYKKYKRLV